MLLVSPVSAVNQLYVCISLLGILDSLPIRSPEHSSVSSLIYLHTVSIVCMYHGHLNPPAHPTTLPPLVSIHFFSMFVYPFLFCR